MLAAARASHPPGIAARKGAGMVAIALALAVFGCGHSSHATGPSTTTASLNFGANNPHTVTAFGDSITQGVLEERKIQAGLLTSNNYPNDLQAMLRASDPTWRVINRGVGGEQVEQGANRIGAVLAADHPGFVLIMEGTNNASHCDEPAFIASRLQAMVQRAKANSTIPLLGTIPPNFRRETCAQDVILNTNVLLHSVASAEGIVLAEIFDGMNDPSLFGIAPGHDVLHPNNNGYHVMANIWLTALEQAVGAATTVAQLHPKHR
jgi:lysophospholipase L1-like esterase